MVRKPFDISSPNWEFPSLNRSNQLSVLVLSQTVSPNLVSMFAALPQSIRICFQKTSLLVAMASVPIIISASVGILCLIRNTISISSVARIRMCSPFLWFDRVFSGHPQHPAKWSWPLYRLCNLSTPNSTFRRMRRSKGWVPALFLPWSFYSPSVGFWHVDSFVSSEIQSKACGIFYLAD